MKCNSCGYELGSKFGKFCPECGTVISNPNKIRCRKCNYEMDGNLKYCPECGEPVKPKDNKDLERNDKYRGRDRRDRGDDGEDDEGGFLDNIIGKIFG